MKVLKLLARILGAVALIAGLSACNKDKDDGMECCTYSYTDYGITYTWKACDDGSVTYTTSEGEHETYNWKDEFDTWAEVKDYFEDLGGDCD